jgi:uncharacterized protein (TIGR02302 family)
MTEQQKPDSLKRLDRKVGWQSFFMGFENLWAAWAKPLLAIGLALILLLSGAITALPLYPRLGLLAVLVALIAWTVLPLFNLKRIKRLNALRKLEQASNVDHRGISSAHDELATEIMDPRAESLWAEHKERQLAKLNAVKLAPPQSRWRQFDPYALRVPVALGLVAALVLGQGSFTQNLREAVRIIPAVPAIPLNLDAWLKPPAYTGRPPLLLTSPVMKEKFASGSGVEVPEKSIFSLRVSGADDPKIRMVGTDGQTLSDVEIKSEIKNGTLTAEATMERPASIIVTDGNKELANWQIVLLPDAPPTVALTDKPANDSKGNLTLKWQAKDDYGVRKVTGEMELADEQDGGTGFESNGIFLFDPPELKFALRRGNSKDEKSSSRFDLAKHPWAGFNVTLNMTAIDAAAQEGKLQPQTFKMPERVFSRALPRALIEQRKQLVLYPERAGHVGKLIDTLNLYPVGLFEGRAPSLMMGAIASRLRNASGYSDIHFAMDQMWDLAVKLEEGSLSDLRAELKALKEELEKALREGAPQERIAELMDKLRGAMDKYLDAMREESERRAAEGKQPPQQQGDQKSISREDLEKMLKDMEEMSKGGNNDMAQQMLEELDKLLQNLEPGGQQQAGEGEGNMDDMMQGLGDMMKKQKRLMDETQRMPGQGEEQGQQGEGQQQGQGEGKGQQQGQGKGLSDRQQQLKKQLEGLRGQGGQNKSLEDAERAMGEAGESLERGDKEGALQKQSEAMDNLRKGAQELAEQMREQGQGQQNREARDGEGQGGNDDPLGRPRATRNPDEGPDKDMVPTERAQQRAREILETLRSKANERDLSDQEKAYIDRLLRGLY